MVNNLFESLGFGNINHHHHHFCYFIFRLNITFLVSLLFSIQWIILTVCYESWSLTFLCLWTIYTFDFLQLNILSSCIISIFLCLKTIYLHIYIFIGFNLIIFSLTLGKIDLPSLVTLRERISLICWQFWLHWVCY